ncbi:MAG TPA: response regulator [Clostridia bacterium]|nr:response regulator [Clostridia bacterium]
MSKRKTILLADEDPRYALLLELALEQAGITAAVRSVNSREQTFAYLNGDGLYADRAAYPMPDIVLLGLRLPLLHDFDVLRWIRSRHELDCIKVGILSGSEFPNEEQVARDLGADCYRVKPGNFEELVEAAERMRVRWLESEEPHETPA